ncbi:MAG: AraC family transcriptional regulator [Spirochaetes bacterium]|nr:AraC family transcriptional regulator [Spirochaetota bacterium]
MLEHATGLLIFFGGGLSLLMALSQALMPNRRKGYGFLSALYLVTAILLFDHYAVMYAGALAVITRNSVAWGIQLQVRFLKYLVGPLFYLYILSLLDGDFSLRGRYLFHFTPQALALAAAVTIFCISPPPTGAVRGIYVMTDIILVLSFFHMIGYITAALKKVRITKLHMARGDRTFSIATLVSILVIVMLLPVTVFTAVGSIRFESAGVAMVSLLMIVIFLLGQRYPEFIQRFSREIRRTRYERSLIEGLNTDDILRRLKELMVDERLYCDEDLTLHRTAVHLSLSPHQLSELLNSRLRVNFNGYVNAYRIQEAKELLEREPERSILSIAYAAGFNSKSVFYSSFRKATGISPAEYRKRLEGGGTEA